LLPEIALTTQLVGRLRAYFGIECSCIFLNIAATSEWKFGNKFLRNLKSTDSNRASIILPFADFLGFVDEEHEQTN
jgi:primosomal protein N' (replication factor Y)